MKIAIVHEWLERFAGSERVLEQLIRCYPEADLFAVVDFMPESERAFLGGRKVTTSFIQKLPLARRKFRNYLQLMPLAIEQFDLSGYDLVISSHHAVAKGAITAPGKPHVSYVHSPMRYAWDLQGQYLRESGLERGLKSLYARWLLHHLRSWDRATADGVDVFVANSSYIANRIRKAYRREAIVVAPPVAVQDFVMGSGPRRGFLAAGRMVPYKRIELIVEAFTRMPEHELTVAGDGTNLHLVEKAARGHANIRVVPPLPRSELIGMMQGSRAMVFAAEEDFGITMVEAQACGTPVIAYGVGGAADIFPPHAPVAVTFPRQNADAIIAAVRQFEQIEPRIEPRACRANALRFSEENFRAAITEVVDRALAQIHS